MRVRHGDLVCHKGRWRAVKNVRTDRRATVGRAVLLIFKSGPALRVNAAEAVTVDRVGRRGGREGR
jgi:hypothetical protein